MQLNDYTPLFQVEKKLRRIDNITIPEVTYRQALWGGGAGLLATVVWFTVLGRLVGLLPLPGAVSFLLPVAFIAGIAVFFGKAATSRMRYGKELAQLVSSWVTFRRTPRRQVDFTAWQHPTGSVPVQVNAIVDAA